MRLAIAVFSCLLCLPVTAQTIAGDSGTFRIGSAPEIRREFREAASSAPAAVLRGLDKLTGVAVDLQAKTDEPFQFGRLTIEMKDCRYPRDNPTGDAYVSLAIRDRTEVEPIFEGWMIASSPALNALDDPRYDIWVIRCKLDDRTPSVVAGESSPRPLMRP